VRGELILRTGNCEERRHLVSEGRIAAIPADVWHRVINTGNTPLKFFCIFEKYEGRS